MIARIGKIKMPPHTVATISKIRLKTRLDLRARLFCTRNTTACSSIMPRAVILLAGKPNNSGTKATRFTNTCNRLIKDTNFLDSSPGAQISTVWTPVSLITLSTSLKAPRHEYSLAMDDDLGLSST